MVTRKYEYQHHLDGALSPEFGKRNSLSKLSADVFRSLREDNSRDLAGTTPYPCVLAHAAMTAR
jgi:hypothetical protein